MKGLGKAMLQMRNAKKLTLVKLAKMSGIDQATLSRIENEKMTGTLESHSRIAKSLGVPLPDLYTTVLTKTVTKTSGSLHQKKVALSKKLTLIAKELEDIARDLF